MADPTGQKSVIDQIYDKLNQLFCIKTQLFCMEFPGRVLDEQTYSYKRDSIYSILCKPQTMLEEEFRPSDDIFDVAQITGDRGGFSSWCSDNIAFILFLVFILLFFGTED